MEQGHSEITLLLAQWSAGDKEALDQLLPIVYADLRRLAAVYLHSRDATIQPTALVNEVYVRLTAVSTVQWQNRNHFFSVVGKLIRRIQVDRYRANVADKRGGHQLRVTLDSAVAAGEMNCVNLLDLDRALNELEKLNPRGAQLIDLRFFLGLSLEETAEVMETSPATLKRDWVTCRHWIKARLNRVAQGASV